MSDWPFVNGTPDEGGYLAGDSYTQFGALWRKFVAAVFDAFNGLTGLFAPLEHEHGEDGTVIVARGDATARPSGGDVLYLRTDNGTTERLQDGAVLEAGGTYHQIIQAEAWG